MKAITYPGNSIGLLAILLLYMISSYAAPASDKNIISALEPGVNYLLPIGFQLATVPKKDTTCCQDKDSLTSKIIKGKTTAKKKIYRMDINPDFSRSTIRKTEEAFKQAELYDADYILIHLDADNPQVEHASTLIQSKLTNNSTPVFFYVDSKINRDRSLLTITPGDTANGASNTRLYNLKPYRANRLPAPDKNMLIKAFASSLSMQSTNPNLDRITSNAVTGNLIMDILQNNNLNSFEVLQYNPGKYGKLVDALTQPGVCLLLVMLLTWLMAIQLNSREAGPYSFFILCLLIIMLGSLYEERLANSNEIILILTGILLLFLNLFYTKSLTWNRLTCIGCILSISGLALTLTSYTSERALFLIQLSINMLLISGCILITLKLYTVLKPNQLKNILAKRLTLTINKEEQLSVHAR